VVSLKDSVACLKFYKSKVPSDSKEVFLRPKAKLDGSCWFTQSPRGKNELQKTIPRLLKRIPLDKKYLFDGKHLTAQSLRVNDFFKLFLLGNNSYASFCCWCFSCSS